MEKEIWKSIPKFGSLSVSNLGHVTRDSKLVVPTIHKRRYHIGTYCRETNKSRSYPISVLVMIAFRGFIPSGNKLIVDHKDNNPLNDSLSNLQITTHRINNSKDKIPLSGYTGVSKSKNKWKAIIHINGKAKYLGTKDTPEEASILYQEAFKNI